MGNYPPYIYLKGYFYFQSIWQMAYNENVQLEFSLDQKETYLASGLTKKAEEYTNLFRFKREALIIANEFWIENNTFYPDKYKILLEERGITYAERYKRYFLLKREIVRIKDFLGFNKELGDEDINIDGVDEEIRTPDDDEIEEPDVKEEKSETVKTVKTVKTEVFDESEKQEEEKEEDIETVRNKFYEAYWKEVPSSMKNNRERMNKKIEEAKVIK